MSFNVIPLSTIKVIPEKFDYKQEKRLELRDEGEDILFQTFPAQNVTNNSITLQANPPGKNYVVDNELMQYFECTFTITATNSDAVARHIFEEVGLSGQETAPRSYPLARCSETVNMQINSSNISTNLNDYLNSIDRYNYDEQDNKTFYSTTPTMLDNTTNYDNTYNKPQRDVINGDVYQSGYMDSRGSYVNYEITSNPSIAAAATGTAVVVIKGYEKLMLSPFYYQKTGLVGIQTMTYTITLGDLTRMLCRRTITPVGNGVPLVWASCTPHMDVFQLQVKFITPKLLDRIPKNTVYDYIEYEAHNSTNSSSLAASAQRTFTMSASNLSAIPSKIFVRVADAKSDLGFLPATALNGGLTNPDVSRTRLDSITVQWGGRSGILSNASPRQLYNIAVENGLKMSWADYSENCGSIFCIDVAKDIGLKSNEAVGLLSAPQLGMNVQVTNISGRAIPNPTLYVTVVYDGVWTNMNGAISKVTGVVSQIDALKNIEQPEMVERSLEKESPLGGRIGGMNPLALASFVKSMIKSGSEAVDKINPLLKKGVELTEQIGLGAEEESAMAFDILRRKLGKSAGGKLKAGRIGGRVISRDEL